MHAVVFEDIVTAAGRIACAVKKTPVLTSSALNALTGLDLHFKCENFQRVGAFKMRGAYNALSQFDADQKRRGVVAASSGNHAQAIACSARLLQMPATIVMPADAPAIKIAATKAYGADVRFYDRYLENREEICDEIAAHSGMTIIPPFNHPHVIAGQGTAALEFMQEVPDLEVICAPLGGGGLLAGTAIAAKALQPDIRVIGCEPLAGNDGQQSFQKGEIVQIDTPKTIADGAQTQALGTLTFDIIRTLVSDVVAVDDPALIQAMQLYAERMKIWVEPTGCLGLGALLSGALQLPAGTRVGVIISGGNVDAARFSQLIQSLR
jgi:threonine dehydratase